MMASSGIFEGYVGKTVNNLRIPKYIRLKEQVKQLIQANQLSPHSKLPTWAELMRTHGYSEITVRKAIDELESEGYVYRVQGKGTFVAERKAEPRRIALVVPNLGVEAGTPHRFFISETAETIFSIQEELRSVDARLVLYLNGDRPEIERSDLLGIAQGGIDGAIVFFLGKKENLDALQDVRDAGLPIVLIDRYMEGFRTDHVLTDNFDGAYQATEFLIESGCSRVFHISMESDLSPIAHRAAGYREAMLDKGLEPIVRNLFSSDDAEVIREIADATLESRVGVFSVHGMALSLVLNQLLLLGARHRNLALSCFDVPPSDVPADITFANVLQPTDQIGKRAVQILMDKLNGSSGFQQVSLKPELVVVNPPPDRRARS